MKRIIFIFGVVLTLILAGCSTDSDTCAHDWSAWAVKVEPGYCVGATHSDDGEAARACATCSETEKRTICGGTEGLAITDGEVTGIGTAGAVTHLCIPDFDPDTGEPVKSIGEWAFVNNIVLVSVRAGLNLTVIDYLQAFSGCTNLSDASFPAVTIIDEGAFGLCASLKEISFPEVTFIGDGAFWNCTSLEEVSFPKATSIDDWAFQDCTNLSDASFPAVTSIGEGAFQNCTSLKEVTLGAITEANFNTHVDTVPGDLRDKYFTPGGGKGTYISDLATPPVWTKQ